jgi:hypothetical protein
MHQRTGSAHQRRALAPHAVIEGRNVGAIVNLADVRAERSRAAGLDLVRGGPDRSISVLRRFQSSGNAALSLSLFPETESADCSNLKSAARHSMILLRRSVQSPPL